ncbi:FkbM family methyltransferase [Hymenobacter busanensis]|uniref:FkbM family methyltransferase n=1 Tax=Hymenobacter busanensis TaxID=2607656 RepID=A0A7L4ZWI5_9BACT|nr:FkbM family methyltransferase [Hymenobacter busanensis]KAA9332266.1 FkbM family methyltransferase [Hymenobacter busanensis]QHJ07397.1 FkbM family methyltransferase [Hymenobacter busanensis]
MENFLHKNSLARIKYLRRMRSTGVTFKEYCDYLYNKKNTSNNVTASSLFGKKIMRNNTFWFVQNVEEIFVDEVYRFESKNSSPFIIDCGANIGLSVIYFKKRFPNSRILAFEADNNIYNTCVSNVSAFSNENVEIVNAAVWTSDGEIVFASDNSLGGAIANSGAQEHEGITYQKVQSIQLKKYLNQKVDFLKIDIEGVEDLVLADCDDMLINVDKIFIEYHSKPGKKQNLDQILCLLTKYGFRYYIKEAWNNMLYPYIDGVNYKKYFYDLQLNIFAFRP